MKLNRVTFDFERGSVTFTYCGIGPSRKSLWSVYAELTTKESADWDESPRFRPSRSLAEMFLKEIKP